MRQSTRLIVNTLITYARMALTVGLGLAVTRLALKHLGDSDYGLLATLGASGVLLLVLSDALTASTQRHIAYEIGRKDHDTLRAVFNTALVIYAGVAAVVTLLGLAAWPLLAVILDIPPGRESTALWVYALTIANIALTILATPHRGFLIARQSFLTIAFYDLSQAVLGFVAVLMLAGMTGDRLLAYAWLLLGVRALAEGLTILFSIVAFPDCRPRPALFRRDQVRRIASFAGWSLFSLTAWRLRVQGTTILVNSFYGSGVSAAYGVASQLGGYQNQIGAAVFRTVRPAMASIEANGGSDGVRSLTLVSSKYLLMLTLLFLIPAQLEMATLLDLWLASVPEHTPILTRLVLLWMGLYWASIGYQMAMEAKGTLGKYSVVMSFFDLAVLVLQGLFLALAPKFDQGRPAIGPWVIPAITILVIAAQNVWRAWFVGRALEMSLARWLREVILPCALVALLGAGVAVLPMLAMDPSPWRLLATTGAFAAAALPAIWFLGMRRWEREHFTRVAAGGLAIARRLLNRRA